MQEFNAAPLSFTESRDIATRKQHFATWGAYAAAAGAALAMSTNASAEIMYSGGVNVTASPGINGPYSIQPFTIAGLQQLLLANNTAKSGFAGLSAPGGPNNTAGPHVKFFATKSGDGPVAKNYGAGQPIVGRSYGGLGVNLRQNNIATDAGGWGPGRVTGFVGFSVQTGSLKGDLGWIQVEVSDTGSPGYPNEAEVIDYAYDSVAGEAIAAGDTGTPEPGTAALSLLALGAAGLLALRKRRNELAAK